jgi:peptidoglycan/xylan/chitin deacetylase (PgdA/CDA1 family)
MKEKGWPGTVAMLTDQSMATKKFAEYQDKIMSWEQVDELVSYGWEISSHSMTHPFLNNATAEELKAEIVLSKTSLEELGYTVNSFTFPYNQNGGIQGQELIAANYSYWRSTETGINPIPAWRHVMSYSLESNTTIEEVEGWLNDNQCGWLVINVHNIQDNPDNDWAITSEFFAEVIAAVETDGAQVVVPSWIYWAYGYAEEK